MRELRERKHIKGLLTERHWGAMIDDTLNQSRNSKLH